MFKYIFISLIAMVYGPWSMAMHTQPVAVDTAIIKIKSQDTTHYPVRLMYTENNESKFVLSAKPVKGVYEFRLPVKGYSKAILYITSQNSIIRTGKSFIPQPAPYFLIKGGKEIAITANFNNPLALSLKANDPEILLYERFAGKERQNNLLIWDQMKIKYAQPAQPEKVLQAEAEIAKYSQAFSAYKREFVASNGNTFAALLVFESYYTELGNAQAFAALKSIATGYKATENWKALYAKLNAANATGKGTVIPAFEVKDLSGKIVNSQKLDGKYLLIDFWGSWCQPCRASHPELKVMYERYKPKGLELLGVAFESGSLENQTKQWKKAIQEDQINWLHVLNTEQNNLVKLFGVSSYPTKILVDPKGNILLRTSGEGDELKKQLALIFDQNPSSAISINKNISRDSLLNYLNKKLNENTEASKAILKEEAEALKKSPEEENLLLAVKLYKAMGNTDAINAVEKDILTKFPKGIMARDLALDQVFSSNPERTNEVVEKEYLRWLAEYPISNYGVKQKEKYNFALLTLIQRFSKANTKEKVDHYLELLTEPNLKTVALYNVGKDFSERKEASVAVKYLTEALKLSKELKESVDPKLQKGFGAMYYSNIVNTYSNALLICGQTDESIRLSAGLLNENNYVDMNGQALVQTLAKALISKGEQLNAFLVLDKYLQKNPQSTEVLEQVKNLYVILNGAKSDFQQYLDILYVGKQKELINHLKSTMITEKAPLFSLYNRKGELVNLADYKGKIVVLDFWATWCVPCVQSFPGMQATLDKYRGNKNVEFLFINTWETKPDFEKSVIDLMDKNQYTFNVLYDKQKDKNDELVVKKYGVTAIPAKFIIDKVGNIRFKVNNSRTDKASVLNELSAMIDMVLKN